MSNALKITATFLLVFLINYSYGQNIADLKLADDISQPLEPNDGGLSFSYFTKQCGIVSSYLVFDKDTYTIFSDKQEFSGLSTIKIPAAKLQSWFGADTVTHTYKEFSFLIAHVSCDSIKYSEYKLPLLLEINAPYGGELRQCPEKPNPYSTNNKIKKIRPVSVFGIISGVGIGIAGVGLESRNGGRNTTPATMLLAAGTVLSVLGISTLYKTVPDIGLNERNDKYNKTNLSKWENDCKKIEQLNSLARHTFTIKFTLR